jgi:sec-independent protein translocase protein TatB
MFDVSFGELLVIAIVALVVIGPEKLPKVARTMGLLAGRMQRYVGAIRADISRELQMQELQKVQESVRQSVTEVQSGLTQEARQIEAPLSEAVQAIESAAKTESPPNVS